LKRIISLIVLLAVVGGLSLFGDSIAEKMLDRELAPLLSRNLGLPVTLAPMKTRLFRLQAKSDRLVMGDSSNPAVVAGNVTVRLSWTHLLRGEIRLSYASASDLMVSVARWPSNDSPLPAGYQFLDPWLPSAMQVRSGYYLNADGDKWPIRDAYWKRPLGGALELQWAEDRAAGPLQITATLDSLANLLALTDFKLALAVAPPPSSGDEAITHWRLQPAGSGYTMKVSLQSGLLQGEVVAGSDTVWRFPEHSSIRIDSLDPAGAKALIDTFSRQPVDRNVEEFLASALPRLSLANHRGQLKIGEIRIGDEMLIDTSVEYITHADGVTLASVHSLGPRGTFSGQGDLQSSAQGWKVSLQAAVNARDQDVGIAARFIDANWHWSSGHTELNSEGQTWGHLLDAMVGQVVLEGSHLGVQETAIRIDAQLNSTIDSFGLEALKIEMGESVITGSVSLAGKQDRKLTVRLNADQLDLDFLFAEQGKEPKPGLPVPKYLGYARGVDIDWVSQVSNLKLPGLAVNVVDASFQRDDEGGQLLLKASGPAGGPLVVDFKGKSNTDAPSDYTVTVGLEQVDLARLFDQAAGILHSRTSGKINFTSSGNDMVSVFDALEGQASLSILVQPESKRAQPGSKAETLKLAGQAKLALDGGRIMGFEIRELSIDSLEQDITGELSLVTGRQPWAVAKFHSERLNIKRIASWLPESKEAAEQEDFLSLLRQMGAVSVILDVDSLQWFQLPLTAVQLEVTSAENAFAIEKLNFTTEIGRLGSKATLSWEGDLAKFKAVGSVADLRLDNFLDLDVQGVNTPLFGSLEINASGKQLGELLDSYGGRLTMQSDPAAATQGVNAQRKVAMTFKRTPEVLETDVESFTWGESSLQGEVAYHFSTPPRVHVDISGGTLVLRPWEELKAVIEEKKTSNPGPLTRAADASGSLVRGVLSAPARLFAGGREPRVGERMFADTLIDTSALKSWEGEVKATLDKVLSSEGEARNVELDVSLAKGVLDINASAGFLNGGTTALRAGYDTTSVPNTVQLYSTFKDVYRSAEQASYPRTGFFDLKSQGASEAELAAHLDGQAYIELGRGPFDYSGVAFLTGNVANMASRTLLPGSTERVPQMRCAVSLLQFTDGMVVTPYGYVARTDQANLIGRMEADLKQETLRVEFDSRSRKGAGISVGSVFSNTVRIQGPLTDPRIVANTTGLLWRGAAAVMTAGLSVVGESVLKRLLASESPCDDIRARIREDLCHTEQPVAASPLVCPAS
jgi:hypothetical protein